MFYYQKLVKLRIRLALLPCLCNVKCNMRHISGFRDTYLGRQVVSRPGGPRAGMGSAGGLGALRAPLAGLINWGGAPAEIEFAAFQS